MKSIIFGFLFGYIIFLIRLKSPSADNILVKDGALKMDTIRHFMKSPLIDKWMWHPRFWDVNWIVMSIMGAVIFYIAF